MFYIVRGICTCDQCDLAFCALQLTTPLMCSSILLCLFASKYDINGIRLNYSTVSSNKFKYINMSSSSFVWASSFIHCLTAPDFGAGVEQPFGCFIVQNRQAVQSVGRSMDWTLEDDMVDGLIFCATLTGRRGGIPHLHKQERKRPTPVRRRLSRTQALLGRVIPGVCVLVSGIKMRGLVGLSAHYLLICKSTARTKRD